MRTVICTVGTSIASGTKPLATYQQSSMPWDVNADDLTAAIEGRVRGFDLRSKDGRSKVSAEINSLNRFGLEVDDRVILLATDTADGRACAEQIARVLRNEFGLEKGNVEIRRISGLQVRDGMRLKREGLPNLIHAVMEFVEQNRVRFGDELILNPTGGYKGVVPFIAVLGMLYRLPTIYVFEFSEQLITLPPLPFTFDLDLFQRALPALRHVDANVAVPETEYIRRVIGYEPAEHDLFMGFVEPYEGGVTISPLAGALMTLDEAKAETLWLSPQAGKALMTSIGNERETLEALLVKLASPAWRTAHKKPFKSSDIPVYKIGAVPQRVAAVVRDGKVYVCRLFSIHDDYEHKLTGVYEAGEKWENYTAWQVPGNLLIEEENECVDGELRAEETLEQLEKERKEKEHIRAMLTRKREEMETLLGRFSRLEADYREASTSKNRLQKINDKLKRKLSDMQATASIPVLLPPAAEDGTTAGSVLTVEMQKGDIVDCVVVEYNPLKSYWRLQVKNAGKSTAGIFVAKCPIPAGCHAGQVIRCRVRGISPENCVYEWLPDNGASPAASGAASNAGSVPPPVLPQSASTQVKLRRGDVCLCRITGQEADGCWILEPCGEFEKTAGHFHPRWPKPQACAVGQVHRCSVHDVSARMGIVFDWFPEEEAEDVESAYA